MVHVQTPDEYIGTYVDHKINRMCLVYLFRDLKGCVKFNRSNCILLITYEITIVTLHFISS